MERSFNNIFHFSTKEHVVARMRVLWEDREESMRPDPQPQCSQPTEP